MVDPDWLTWPEAAELVGCPVSTIDWHTRTGRIAHRPFHGNRPSLDRHSVEQFATWYRARETARIEQQAARREEKARAAAERAARRKELREQGIEQRRIAAKPPGADDWMNTTEAGALLGLTPDMVARLTRDGRLDYVTYRNRRWVREVDVRAELAERERWLSHVEASEILGVHPKTIGRWAAAGCFERKPGTRRGQPSLSRASVEKVARTLS